MFRYSTNRTELTLKEMRVTALPFLQALIGSAHRDLLPWILPSEFVLEPASWQAWVREIVAALSWPAIVLPVA